MQVKLLSTAAAAATVFLLALPGQAQTYTDNAANAAYSPVPPSIDTSYGGKNGGSGFGPFKVIASAAGDAAAGTFVFTAAEAEGNNGIPKPDTIDFLGKSFGFFAHGTSAAANDPSVTITRSFNVPLANTGDTFSLDFVTGYNDGGTSGVALTNKDGAVGKFCYEAGGAYLFNGRVAVTGYKNGAMHLVYTLTSPTAYSLTVTGAVTYSGMGTFTSPITGFQVQAVNASNGKASVTSPDHNGYFNNLSLKSFPKKP